MSVISVPWEIHVDGHQLAKWNNGRLKFGYYAIEMTPEDAAIVATWIAAGPPQKRYKITRTFDEEPMSVYGHSTANGVCGQAYRLIGGDIEEVYE